MTTTNIYKDTTAVDYLEAIKKHQLEALNEKSSAANFNLTYSLPILSQVGVSNDFTNTQQTLADYQITENRDDLIAWFPFDLDINDASNSNHGTMIGTETYVDFSLDISSTHAIKKALSFNGSSYITLANESNFDFQHTTPFSVSFWVYMSNTSADQGLICKSNDLASGIGWKIYFQSTGSLLVFKISDGINSYSITSATAILVSRWYHIVCTYAGNSNRSGMKIYMKGVLETTGTASAISANILNSSNVAIGAESDGGSVATCNIAEVQIYAQELSSADVVQLTSGRQLNFIAKQTNLFLETGTDIETETGDVMILENTTINLETGIDIETETGDVMILETMIERPALLGLSDVT